MINLRIIMNNGKEYDFKNQYANTVSEFIRAVISKHGTNLNWYEVLPGKYISVSQIESIRELSNAEIDKINHPTVSDGQEIVFDEDKDNQDITDGTKEEGRSGKQSNEDK